MSRPRAEDVAEPLTERIEATFSVPYRYTVEFTTDFLDPANGLLAGLVDGQPGKVLAVVDEGLLEHQPDLLSRLASYAAWHEGRLTLAGDPLLLPGGEEVKDDPAHAHSVVRAIYDRGIDRHSYVLAIGGGALLDAAGYGAAIAHRGVRLLRVPTTVLAQADSGVGVKNSINAFATKNFIGTFVPPVAVINDAAFLETLPDRDWLGGISEAVKVALLMDDAFFEQLEALAPALVARDGSAMATVIRHCARLHVAHIAGRGDPFETKSARPLDFGHWSAHKLERISEPQLRHGEAVAIGLALDLTYASLAGILAEADRNRGIAVMRALRLPLSDPALSDPRLIAGLREFREHLGGQLTVAMIDRIGHGLEVHEMDHRLIAEAINRLNAEEAEASHPHLQAAKVDPSVKRKR